MLSVVIPTINEAANLRDLLPQVFRYAQEVVVVDDGSTDDTVAVAKEHGCTVLARDHKTGVGRAVYDGAEAATGDIVAVMDADHSHPIDALKSVVLIEIDSVDIIKFSRFISGGAMESQKRHSWMRRFNRLMAGVAGVQVHDFTGGYVVGKKSTFAYPKTAVQGEWNIEYMIRNKGKRIAEIPYLYRRRTQGDSKWNSSQDMGRVFRYLYYLAVYKCRSLSWK